MKRTSLPAMVLAFCIPLAMADQGENANAGVPYSAAGFVGEEAERQMLPGNWMRAWLVTWEDFGGVPDLEPAQRVLENYRFGFAETESHYVVHYRPLLTSEVEGVEATDSVWGSIGRETRYWVDKADFSIARRLFYK